MTIPVAYTDAVLGPQGSRLNQIRQASGATVTVTMADANQNLAFEITGNQTQVSAAQRLVDVSVGDGLWFSKGVSQKSRFENHKRATALHQETRLGGTAHAVNSRSGRMIQWNRNQFTLFNVNGPPSHPSFWRREVPKHGFELAVALFSLFLHPRP